MEHTARFFLRSPAYTPENEMLDLCIRFFDSQTLPKQQFGLILPYPLLSPFVSKFQASGLQFCADEMLNAAPNSFTASIAGKMLKEAGATYALIGSREERMQNKEGFSAKDKILNALESGLVPLLAVGESWLELEDERSQEVLQAQISEALSGLPREQCAQVITLYEAPWSRRYPRDSLLAQLPSACERVSELLKSTLAAVDATPRIVYSLPALSPEFFQALQPFSPAGYYLGSMNKEMAATVLPD